MEITVGKKIANLRKEKGMTQDDIAEKLNVSPQAVSKWENDVSYPDIMLLPKIAKLLDTTVDDLLSSEPKKEIMLVKESERKSIDDMILKIIVNDKDEKVKINLPMSLVKIGLQMGMSMPQVSGNEALKNIKMEQIFSLVESGVIGKLVEVEGSDGEIVEIVVE
jgi:transcriptional regulator with XRE-family HTH domain